MTLLFSNLVIGSVLLVPGEPLSTVGTEVVCVGVGIGVVTSRVTLRSLRLVPLEDRRWHVMESGRVVLPPVLYVAAGFLFVLGESNGTYLFVPAILIAFIIAIIDSWVLLVEINR